MIPQVPKDHASVAKSIGKVATYRTFGHIIHWETSITSWESVSVQAYPSLRKVNELKSIVSPKALNFVLILLSESPGHRVGGGV